MKVNQKPQLFTIHFAGGNCHSFNFLNDFLTPFFEVIPLELPGRGRRFGQKLLTDSKSATRDLLNEWAKKRKKEVPFGIYGHSMGALLGFELSKILTDENLRFLVVSGNPGPNIEKEKLYYNLETSAFTERLKKLGGIPDEVFQHSELLTFFEPILRADFEIAECYTTDSTLSNTPIYAIMGSDESYSDSIENWKKYTTSSCKTFILAGNHFFINDQPKELTSLLKTALDETLAY